MRQENVAVLAGDRTVSDNRGAMPDSPHLSVRVLGPARLTVDGAAAPPELLWRKHLALPDATQFEPWLGAERTLGRAQGLEALVKSAEAQLARGDTAAATRAALGAGALEATSEPAARTAMRALALAGDRAAAVRVAENLARALRDALDAAPSPEMARLVERIREARVGRRILAAPPAARPRPPLLGRSAELAAAAAAWERAKAARGQVVLVQGEPGEGKTRLIEELVARARLD